MNFLYKLRDYTPTMIFEAEHPKQLRWNKAYKLWMLEENDKCQGIWMKNKDQLIGEIIVSWQSDNVLEIETLTILPEYRRKGYATELVEKMLDWAENSGGYQWLIGEARTANSWSVFSNLGAKQILVHKNWNDTGEDYTLFKLEI